MTKRARSRSQIALVDRLRVASRWVSILVLLGMVAFLISHMGVEGSLADRIKEARESLTMNHLVLGALLYMVLLAIPFFPGIEVGLALMACFGDLGVLVVYATTNLGLNLSFVVGRQMPHRWIVSLYRAGQNPKGRLDAWAQGRLSFLGRIPFRIKRALGLFVILNSPFNSLVGGGGGLSFLSGMDRRYPQGEFALTILVATTPLPILALLGIQFI